MRITVDGLMRLMCFNSESPSSLPKAFPILQQYAAKRGILALNVAISEHDGTTDLYVVERAMAKGELVSPINGMEWSEPDWAAATTLSVPCLSLDTWCSLHGMPDLVKVDTEGHEGWIIDGATTLLEYGCGWIIEFHTPLNRTFCSTRLELYGYEVETIRHPHYAPESPMWHQHGWVRAEKGK